ncbi:hypothetical protein F7725_022330 [Dissostichus mawsoni]|uniref:Homeobox domain-containing protein n=1 Tax=Dissostichus mawsoni TaxID=36200 RepID=A0A7J5YXN0_DISMA|nr:hypothetical protein F7725_022330 [Dissostichus mawsoni]
MFVTEMVQSQRIRGPLTNPLDLVFKEIRQGVRLELVRVHKRMCLSVRLCVFVCRSDCLYKTSPESAQRAESVPLYFPEEPVTSADDVPLQRAAASSYPAFLRPPAALSSPLNRSLHSGFLVEDLLRWSQPVSYIHRTFSSRSPGDILQLSAGQCGPPRLRGPGTERCVPPPGRGTPGSPQPGGPEPGYLKFGVSAILAPSTRSVQSVQKSFPLPFFDGSLHPFIRASYFTASSSVVPVPGTFSWPLAPRGKPRRGMLRRAVFSDLQRKALERTFQKQKYISKTDRKKLASKLGLKDSQVLTL